MQALNCWFTLSKFKLFKFEEKEQALEKVPVPYLNFFQNKMGVGTSALIGILMEIAKIFLFI